MKNYYQWSGGLMGVGLMLMSPTALSASMADQKEVRRFIMEVSEEHGFSPSKLQQLFAMTEPDKKVLALISKPAEKKEWSAYRPIFITNRNTAAGQRFIRHHRIELKRAESVYGVPASVISAIIGVETRYGANTGSHRVFRSLATLAFYYPRRSDFFRKELIQFLLLVRDLGGTPDQLDGSYAGAMGIPQFMPSSYRHYAVDFDGDRRIDIWHSVTDAIGSVANYLSRHGWQRGGGIASRLAINDTQWRQLTADGDRVPAERLKSAGVKGTGERRLIRLSGSEGMEYWAVNKNFDVITKYNHSDLYAMAVFQLAESISIRQEDADNE